MSIKSKDDDKIATAIRHLADVLYKIADQADQGDCASRDDLEKTEGKLLKAIEATQKISKEDQDILDGLLARTQGQLLKLEALDLQT